MSNQQPEPVELLADLNPPQRQAVLHIGSPLLVVAGAGSGKTRVLTRRIAYLIAARGVHPGEILAITFTNKAAAEMRARVEALVGRRAKLMWVSTFHSACLRFLRADADQIGLSRGFTIYDDTDQRRLMASIVKSAGFDQKKFSPRTVLSWISRCKDELLDAAAASRVVTTSVARGSAQGDEEAFAGLYQRYEAALRAANAVDFDDLLMLAVKLLTTCPSVREHYRRRFRHVLVDEYQDTNHAQYALIQALCGPDEQLAGIGAPQLMVVGDSDQSIYAFRGANVNNILDFADDFPGAARVVLEQNYRSTQTILSAANSVIEHNSGRQKKNLWTNAGDGPKIIGWVGDTEYDEARFVTQEIARLNDQGRHLGDMAVFYRTNAQSRVVEEAFVRAGLAYKVLGGVRFYERKEVRDALAYLRVIANQDDDVSMQRIINEPRRGIGETSIKAVADIARRAGISFGQALRQAGQAGLSTRATNAIVEFVAMLDQLRALVTEGTPADEVVAAALEASGLRAGLRASKDPQDQSRLDNLDELAHVAAEFVALAHSADIDQDDESAELAGELVGGMPEPDDSLGAFLERIALASDTDALPDGGDGVVTLMTLHSAKGLEFDTVFMTGLEDGVFPHTLAMADPAELAEERRLAYVGITRARQLLYTTRAAVRTQFGQPQYNPASRFFDEIPAQLINWRRVGADLTAWPSRHTPARQADWRRFGKRDDDADGAKELSWVSQWDEPTGAVIGGGAKLARSPKGARTINTGLFEPGDKVIHDVFGLGTVIAASGVGDARQVDVDFGQTGRKRLVVRYAPMEKL